MSQLQLIDTFPAFQEFWLDARHKPLDDQLDDWATVYMAPWPELLNKQLDDYAALGEDWRAVAAEHVFPYLDQRLPDMVEIHCQLADICAAFYIRAQETLGLDCDLVALFYVGIGCGAGWVTTYADRHAILFGLENIAEEGWTQETTVKGLVAHELGHVAHFYQREQAYLADGSGPWWQLYIEGVAQWSEHLMLGQTSWHMQDEEDKDWLEWCQENRGWLAAEFLRRVDEGEEVRPFFGSWYDLNGYKQTGYFLGHEIIQNLAEDKSLHEIALIEDMAIITRALEKLRE
jgi:hypothetical protein